MSQTMSASHAGAVENPENLAQFSQHGQCGDIGYCVAAPRPYSLTFSNATDVVCLLLGRLETATAYDEERTRAVAFNAQTSAFHPAGGKVSVRADTVRGGFIAFTYPRNFREHLSSGAAGELDRCGSVHNIQTEEIRLLSAYVRRKIRSAATLGPTELDSIANLVYFETARGLNAVADADKTGLSDSEFARIRDFIVTNLDHSITCSEIAAVVDLPIRITTKGLKVRTGLTPYKYVLRLRTEKAAALLSDTDMPIAEIAYACGFSSQQHLTATLSQKLGISPRKLRST